MIKAIIFVLLISLWIFLSSLNVSYNAVKLISEIKDWAFLSDSAKRNKIFGVTYSYIIFIEKNTAKNAKIALLSDDNMLYYLARYYLYPRRLYVVSKANDIEEINKGSKIEYVTSLRKDLKLKNYIKIASFVDIYNQGTGVIYKFNILNK